MKNSRVLITGVAGFIGSRLAQKFLLENFEVIGVDDLSTGSLANIPQGVKFLEADLSDYSQFSSLNIKCDVILHLAGQSSGEISFENPISDLEKNCHSTLNLIKWGIDNSVKKIVYASSMSVYGDVPNIPIDETHPCNPKSCYGVGKLASENYLKVYQNQLPYTILRMFNVYGPGQDMNNMKQGMLSIFLSQAFKSRVITIKGSLQRFRDFVFIDDVINTWYNTALDTHTNNKTFNLGSGKKTTVGELVDKIIELVPGTECVVVEGTQGDQFGIFADNSSMKLFMSDYKFTELDCGLKIFVNSLVEGVYK